MNNPKHLHLGNVYGDIAPTAGRAATKQQLHDELEEAISSSTDVLCTAKTLFPLTLFPDTITVDRAKVSVTKRNFFMTGEAVTIRIEDILNVTASVGPIIGSIKITTKYFNPERPYVVDKLKRRDALRIKRILQGYVIARQQNVDTSLLSSKELAKYLDEIGNVAQQDKL